MTYSIITGAFRGVSGLLERIYDFKSSSGTLASWLGIEAGRKTSFLIDAALYASASFLFGCLVFGGIKGLFAIMAMISTEQFIVAGVLLAAFLLPAFIFMPTTFDTFLLPTLVCVPAMLISTTLATVAAGAMSAASLLAFGYELFVGEKTSEEDIETIEQQTYGL